MNELNATIIKIDLLNYELGLQNPALVSLLKEGWVIVSTVPVDDNGKPTLLMLLQRNKVNEKNKRETTQKLIYCIVLLLTCICILISNIYFR